MGIVAVGETANLLKAGQKLSKWHCSLSDLSPTYSTTTQLPELPRPGKYPRVCPLLFHPLEEQIKAPERIQLSDKEIANLSDAQFKTLVIRMLTEMIEYGCKIKEEV